VLRNNVIDTSVYICDFVLRLGFFYCDLNSAETVFKYVYIYIWLPYIYTIKPYIQRFITFLIVAIQVSHIPLFLQLILDFIAYFYVKHTTLCWKILIWKDFGMSEDMQVVVYEFTGGCYECRGCYWPYVP
jgi:hypothetical protein